MEALNVFQTYVDFATLLELRAMPALKTLICGTDDAPLFPDGRQVESPPPSLHITSNVLVFYGVSHDITFEKECGSKSYIFKNLMNYFLKLLSALIGGKSIFTKKSFTRFSLQSECSNFNQ